MLDLVEELIHGGVFVSVGYESAERENLNPLALEAATISRDQQLRLQLRTDWQRHNGLSNDMSCSTEQGVHIGRRSDNASPHAAADLGSSTSGPL